MRLLSVRCLYVPIIAALQVLYPSRARAQELEIEFGASAAGQIKALIEFPQPIELPISIYRGIPGYARADFGFHSTFLDEPEEDFFQFSPDANFEFILLSKTVGMEVWNDHGSGFLPVGGRFFVGPSQFDTHPMWNIPNLRQRGTFALTLQMHDMNGLYADSDPITLSFMPLNRKGLILHDDPMFSTEQTLLPESAPVILAFCAAVSQLLLRRRPIVS